MEVRRIHTQTNTTRKLGETGNQDRNPLVELVVGAVSLTLRWIDCIVQVKVFSCCVLIKVNMTLSLSLFNSN